MAGERTEAATPERREQLRRQGRLPRSQELQTAAGLLAGFIGLQWLGGEALHTLANMLKMSLGKVALATSGDAVFSEATFEALFQGASAALPLMALAGIGGATMAAAQTGLLVSAEPLNPSFERVNPLKTLRRWFSQQNLLTLLRDILKLGIVGLVTWQLVDLHLATLLQMSLHPVPEAASQAALIAGDIGLRSSVIFALLAGLDYVYQRWNYEHSIQMSKEEVKESLRQTEGDTQTKSRSRAQARRFARSRMITAVPRASVIITNPVHLAVALEYRPGDMAAPRVVAKGERLLAQRIRDLATQHGIPIVENPPLAWAIHRAVEVDEFIPPALYVAVAEILAFILSLPRGNATKQGAQRGS